MIASSYPSVASGVAEALADYQAASDAVGCPRDQFANFTRAGIVLQPVQLAFASAARQCDRPGGPTQVGFGGARMGGKSHAILSQIGADDCIRHPGLKALMLRKAGASGKESFEALLPKTIAGLGTYVPSSNTFKHDNGSWIKLGHFQNEADIDKYLGLEYDVIGIEEATTLSSAKERAVRSCCRSPEGSGWRARMYSSTNPGGVGHAWYKARFIEPFRKHAETDTRFIPATAKDNRFTSREYHAFLDGLTGWLRRAWRDGDWDIAAGQFFTTFRRDDHVIPRISILPSWRVWLALDYGFTHYTAIYLLAQDGDGHVYVVGEHAEQRWLVDRHSRAIDAMLARHSVPRHRLQCFVAGEDVFAKKQNGGTVADDYKAHGWYLTAANTDRINGAAEILRRLGDADSLPPMPASLAITESCPRLIECLPSLEHDPHRPEDILKVDTDENGLGGDDPYDAFRYGIMVAARPRVGSPSVGPPRSSLVTGRGQIRI